MVVERHAKRLNMNYKTKSIYEDYWHQRLTVGVYAAAIAGPSEIYETVYSVLGMGDKILDIGCGNGDFGSSIRDKYNLVYGIDIAKEAADIARHHGIYTVIGDLNSLLPWKDNTFSAITCLEVIEHLNDPVSLLKKIYRLLTPCGQFVLTTPNIRYFRNLSKLIFHGEFPHTSTDTFVWGGGHLHFFTRKDIQVLLTMTGFEKIHFHINQEQFDRSRKRKLLRFLIGEKTFSEFFVGSITVSAYRGG